MNPADLILPMKVLHRINYKFMNIIDEFGRGLCISHIKDMGKSLGDH